MSWWGAVSNFLRVPPQLCSCLASLQSRQFSSRGANLPLLRQAPLTHTHTRTQTHYELGRSDQAGQFDHLAPCPAPRCLWTPSSVRPFPAPLASPSSSFLCSGVSPPSLPLSSLSPPPACCLPPLFPPASFLLLLFGFSPGGLPGGGDCSSPVHLLELVLTWGF